VFDGKLWALGNFVGAGNRKVLSSIDGATWTEAGSDALPIGLFHHASVVFGDKLWVVGGNSGVATRKVFYSADAFSSRKTLLGVGV
jgi:hypothetical protein